MSAIGAVSACRCLNVTLWSSALGSPSQTPPDLPKHSIFQKNLTSVPSDTVNCRSVESTLLEEEFDDWKIFQCHLCLTYTHAISKESPQQTLVNTTQILTPEMLSTIAASTNYSPVFKILIDQVQTPELERKSSGSIVANMRKYMTRTLMSEFGSIEEEIKQFSDRKYKEFEELKERAHQDFNLISNALMHTDEAETLPSELKIKSESGPVIIPIKTLPLQTTTTTVSVKSKNSVIKDAIDLTPRKEDSLEEDIFDLEGMDSSVSPQSGHNSASYESDSDDSESRDEGIHITRASNSVFKADIAKSLPMNVPQFAHFHDDSHERKDRNVKETRDIAASIKALARSVHGDVFGDLPRPRFSTQF